MGVVTLWYPAYWLDGIIKFFTALVSIFTAAAIWWAMPKALALPSMAQLEDANRRLQHEIDERQRAEAALRNLNAELEQRVAARTGELEAEIAQRRHTEETCVPASRAGAACSRPPRSARLDRRESAFRCGK
jgi:hypothetical protein